MATGSSERFVLLDRLGEEFAERFRRGERPSLQEYIDRHPDLAAEIREFFPAMVDIERVKGDRDAMTGPATVGPLPPLQRLGDYRIVREIGRGGMGVVYEAEQVSLGRRVALKVLPGSLLADPRTHQRFDREARSAARLHHTNIVPVFGVGEHEGQPYYVMQFIRGSGLDEVLDELKRLQATGKEDASSNHPRREDTAADVARSLWTGRFVPAEIADATELLPSAAVEAGPPAPPAVTPSPPAPSAPSSGLLSGSFAGSGLASGIIGGSSGSKDTKGRPSYWQSVARVGAQVADALQHAHGQGVLHRDIKPSNLLLDTEGVIWVADFGLAKVTDQQQDLTHTGDVLGTLRYMPPEAFDGKGDHRGDVYSLGLTLYELLALRPAFDESDRNRLIRRVTTEEPERLDRINREIPRDLVTIVQKAIEREASHRYQAAGELMADLQRFLDDEPILARRQTSMERLGRWARRNRGIASLSGSLAAALILAAVVSLIAAGRMAVERTRADLSRREAEASGTRARDALAKAEQSYARARGAVRDYLTAVSDDPNLKAAGLSPLRARLLQSALAFYQVFLQENSEDPALRRELADVYSKVGSIFADLGQPSSASASFARSRRLYEALAAEKPRDAGLKDGLARVLSELNDFDRAIAIWESLIRPDSPEFHERLGLAYSNAAILAENRKDRVARLDFLRKALEVRERLVRLRPDDWQSHVGLGESLNNIAVGLYEKRHAIENLALFRRAKAEAEIASRLAPNEPEAISLRITCTRNLANTSGRSGAVDESMAAWRLLVELLDRRARDNPGVPGLDEAMVRGQIKLIDALRLAGRLEEATRVAERARERIAEAREETRAFIYAVQDFHLATLAVAVERSRDRPEGNAVVDREAAMLVEAMRRYVLMGWRDPNWLRTDPRTEPLRARADFQGLLARVEELVRADTVTGNAGATPDEKLAARRRALAGMEAVARPLPPSRPIRRTLTRARQDLGKALLDAGHAEEARTAFDEAEAESRALIAEAPSDPAARIDLVQGQFATGNLLAASGRLREAVAAWEGGLAALETVLAEDPNRIPSQLALTSGLAEVGENYLRRGLWAEALRCYRRAFEVREPEEFIHWEHYALALDEAGDARGLAVLIRRALDRHPDVGNVRDELSYDRLLLLASSDDPRWREILTAMAENPRSLAYPAWDSWVRTFARARLGRAKGGLSGLSMPGNPYWRWPSVALAEHRLGHAEAARAALRRADEEAEAYWWLMSSTADSVEKRYFWPQLRSLRRQAHRAIEGGPMLDTATERLVRAKALVSLGRDEEAESEFAAAVSPRPGDSKLWSNRARIFAGLGLKERALADLAHARELRVDDPSTWIESGRLLAEMGEARRSEEAFARASVLAGGRLSPFLEAGWWVVGPYPDSLDLACPPENDPDPARPVAVSGGEHVLEWKAVATNPSSHEIDLAEVSRGKRNVSFYALAYVHADRDRTAVLSLRTVRDARLWVNGCESFAGFEAWGYPSGTEVLVPISLRAGRNTILLKIRAGNGWTRCTCLIDVDSHRRALEMADLGLWAEAADAFAEADRHAPLALPDTVWLWAACQLAAGRDDEARRAFGEVIGRFDKRGSDDPPQVVTLCPLLPGTTKEDRERWLLAARKALGSDPYSSRLHHHLAYASYLAGHYSEAEVEIRRAMELGERPHFRPLLAAILQKSGKVEEAREVLREAERRHAELVKLAIADQSERPVSSFETRAGKPASPFELGIVADQADRLEDLWYALAIREARRLVHGADAGPTADEVALRERRLRHLTEMERVDEFGRIAAMYPAHEVAWSPLGRRPDEPEKSDEAMRAFAKAVEQAPGNLPLRINRARYLAALGRWDEAAEQFGKALEMSPEPESKEQRFPIYPWMAGRGEADEAIARSDEVYRRVASARPDDRTLSARRAEWLAEVGRWDEAEAAFRAHIGRFPDDWWAPTLLAKSLLDRGKLDDYRRTCRDALDRFGGQDATRPSYSRYFLPINLVRVALLGQAGCEGHPMASALLADAAKQTTTEFWLPCTASLVELRRGNAEAALRRLDASEFVSPYFPNNQAMADAVRALTLQKLGRQDEARAALGRSRAAVEAYRRWPDVGAKAYDWHNWLQVEILLREAEGLIPDAKDTTTDPAAVSSLAGEQAARRERRARADRAETRAALAWLLADSGREPEALAELKGVRDERTRLVAEEPDNDGYRTALVSTRMQIIRITTKAKEIELIPVASRVPVAWRYTTQKPPEGWTRPDFDDSHWKEGPAPFGVDGTPNLSPRTKWDTPDIWARRLVEVPASTFVDRARLLVYHDDDLEVFIDGVPAARWSGYSIEYQAAEVSSDARGAIRPGARIVVAAHCHQSRGGQGVDLGLSLVASDAKAIAGWLSELRDAAVAAVKLTPGTAGRRRIVAEISAGCHAAAWAASEAGGEDGDIARMLSEIADIVQQVGGDLDADGWLALAALRGRVGDRDRARKAARRAIAAGLRPSANGSPDPMAATLALTIGLDDPTVAQVLAAVNARPPAALDPALARPEDQARAHSARAEWYAARFLLGEAATDLAEANRAEPSWRSCFRLAIATAAVGDPDRYREACRALIDLDKRANDPENAERVLKACSLRPDSGIDPDRLARLVRSASAVKPGPSPAEWAPFAVGLAAYRSGRYAEAIEALRESRRRNEALPKGAYQALTAAILEVEAMTLFRLGGVAAARRSLDRARRIKLNAAAIDGLLTNWYDWATVEVLDREARSLLDAPAGTAP
jgi:serine/threonine protein kinase/tetratricopeptide (TPR) repeat protein